MGQCEDQAIQIRIPYWELAGYILQQSSYVHVVLTHPMTSRQQRVALPTSPAAMDQFHGQSPPKMPGRHPQSHPHQSPYHPHPHPHARQMSISPVRGGDGVREALHIDTSHRGSDVNGGSGDEGSTTGGDLPPGVTAVNTRNGTILRKQREFIPDNRKDESYWDRRRRNNEAAKRSREKRRFNDMILEQRVVELTRQTHFLQAQLEVVREKFGLNPETLIDPDKVLASMPTADQILAIVKRNGKLLHQANGTPGGGNKGGGGPPSASPSQGSCPPMISPLPPANSELASHHIANGISHSGLSPRPPKVDSPTGSVAPSAPSPPPALPLPQHPPTHPHPESFCAGPPVDYHHPVNLLGSAATEFLIRRATTACASSAILLSHDEEALNLSTSQGGRQRAGSASSGLGLEEDLHRISSGMIPHKLRHKIHPMPNEVSPRGDGSGEDSCGSGSSDERDSGIGENANSPPRTQPLQGKRRSMDSGEDPITGPSPAKRWNHATAPSQAPRPPSEKKEGAAPSNAELTSQLARLASELEMLKSQLMPTNKPGKEAEREKGNEEEESEERSSPGSPKLPSIKEERASPDRLVIVEHQIRE
ncbi:unnamed protein product [Cyprideis torosa]|uniref:Uncharacterized protein n=1 Tax=Cyprideis torosa TaxID=163714 RepID=A0A7R8ZQI4_9CRUS|nr:unnamed protein product [Cyprideis torosa]CAG0892121.1 unnamed protein product [Cyprideis torosa]